MLSVLTVCGSYSGSRSAARSASNSISSSSGQVEPVSAVPAKKDHKIFLKMIKENQFSINSNKMFRLDLNFSHDHNQTNCESFIQTNIDWIFHREHKSTTMHQMSQTNNSIFYQLRPQQKIELESKLNDVLEKTLSLPVMVSCLLKDQAELYGQSVVSSGNISGQGSSSQSLSIQGANGVRIKSLKNKVKYPPLLR